MGDDVGLVEGARDGDNEGVCVVAVGEVEGTCVELVGEGLGPDVDPFFVGLVEGDSVGPDEGDSEGWLVVTVQI